MSGKFYLCQIMAKYIQLTILWIFSGINIAGSSVAWMWRVGHTGSEINQTSHMITESAQRLGIL